MPGEIYNKITNLIKAIQLMSFKFKILCKIPYISSNFGSFSLESEIVEIEEKEKAATKKDPLNAQKAKNISSVYSINSIWEAFGKFERNFGAVGLFLTAGMEDEINGLKTLHIHQVFLKNDFWKTKTKKIIYTIWNFF